MNLGGVLPRVLSRQAGPGCLRVTVERPGAHHVPSSCCVTPGRLRRGRVELHQVVQAESGTVRKGLGTLLQDLGIAYEETPPQGQTNWV